jgi:hypothetical protein
MIAYYQSAGGCEREDRLRAPRPPLGAFTLDTYAHVMPGMQAAAVRQLSDLIDGAAETPTAAQP